MAETRLLDTAPAHHAKSVGGFTLLELLVAMAVAVILMTIAVPSYRGIVVRNQLAANVNDLIGALNYARSEAVGRGTSVYICASRDHKTCYRDESWNHGWIVYAPAAAATDPKPDAHNLLRVHSAVGSGLNLTTQTKPPLSFNADGFAIIGRTFTATAKNNRTATYIRVASTGRIDTSRSSSQ